MFLSVFDLFKIGIGPSSSHTVGPMVAANLFLQKISDFENKVAIAQVRVFLHGSLAFTGKGHATDISVILGLCGERPETTDPDQKDNILSNIKANKFIQTAQGYRYQFDPEKDVIFDYEKALPGHPNGMVFEGLDLNGQVILRQIYYSVGGGFVSTPEQLAELKQKKDAKQSNVDVPYGFATSVEMLKMAKESGLSIAQMKRQNELCFMSEQQLNAGLDAIWNVMDACIQRGLRMEGELPGGIHFYRRAKEMQEKLKSAPKLNLVGFRGSDYVSLYALAVNEENAAGGKIVTAPTNGASGVIPAVIKYYIEFYQNNDPEKIREFLLTSAAIGGLLKHNASISGAEVGCQGEVGSASSMAAAGLAACLGGTAEQIENAAEIALEHHLGLTCDPVAGLVQVPCIERNAMGANKAVTAASLALLGDGSHYVTLDACIKTMKETGLDMSTRYKETSLAGLAVNVVNC